ncbi:MAG: serine/threonine-protein kinase [Pseudomonadales bacterium]
MDNTTSLPEDPDDATRLRTAISRADDDDATLVQSATHAQQATAAQPMEELQPGELIKDRFEIVSVLGRGGMGVVYRALDRRKVEAQDRDPFVALKALSSAFQREERMVVALQREARKAQTLAHPNIATVYDFDRDGDLVYITMEQLAGMPMDDFIREHPQGLPRARVLPMLRGLCLALAYAHNKGIVHSDFKPGNVFLNEGDNPKILEFGIARAAPVSEDLSAGELTRFDAGELGALTPSYAALEMFQGAPPHPADDVYALAITAYQLFTGRHPFNGIPAPQASREGLKPEPIRGLRRREWQAIRRGLAFARKDRIGHAADFLRVFEGKARTRLAIGSAIALALAFGLYFTMDQVEERARTQPEVPFDNLPAETRSAFETLLNDGDMSRKFADHAGALDAYRQAYALHPRNPEATLRLVDLLELLYARASDNGDTEALLSLGANLDEVMATDGFLGSLPRLQALKQSLERS